MSMTFEQKYYDVLLDFAKWMGCDNIPFTPEFIVKTYCNEKEEGEL